MTTTEYNLNNIQRKQSYGSRKLWKKFIGLHDFEQECNSVKQCEKNFLGRSTWHQREQKYSVVIQICFKKQSYSTHAEISTQLMKFFKKCTQQMLNLKSFLQGDWVGKVQGLISLPFPPRKGWMQLSLVYFSLTAQITGKLVQKWVLPTRDGAQHSQWPAGGFSVL